MGNIRRERFVKVAPNRVNKILEDFRLLGNCSNKGNYEYTNEEVQKIFRTLDKEYANLKKRFENSDERTEKFRL